MIYAHAGPRRLAMLRVAVLVLWLYELASDPFERLAALPRAWFEPHGPWLLAPDAVLALLWNETALFGLKLAALASVSLALLGLGRPRLCMALALALVTLVTSFVRGFGHADHADVPLLWATLALALLPAWDALTVSKAPVTARAPGTYARACALVALVFSFGYFETAVHRLAREGGQIFLGPSILHFIARDTAALDDLPFTFGAWLVEQPGALVLCNAGFLLVTVAELAAPFAHLRRSVSIAWLAVILPFHLLAPIVMHVFFRENLVLLCALYVWPLWAWRAPEVPAPRELTERAHQATVSSDPPNSAGIAG